MDQSSIGGNFMWLSKAEARCKIADLEGAHQFFEGEHDGYRRLSDPLVHRRRIAFDANINQFRVEDELDCDGVHEAQVCWHFSEQCTVTVDGTSVLGTAGNARLRLQTEPPAPPASLLWGREDPPAGWISRSFDVKSETCTAVWTFPVRGVTRFTTIIRLDFT
jgi:hypothetical protein